MTDWHATVEYNHTVTQDQAEDIARWGEFTVVTIDREHARTTVSFGVTASTLRQATDTALRHARELVAGVDVGDPVAIRVITDAALAVEVERPQLPELVDSAGAREILGGISQQRLYELTGRADFPEPVQTFAGGRSVWVRAAIEGFLSRWDRKPGRPRKAT